LNEERMKLVSQPLGTAERHLYWTLGPERPLQPEEFSGGSNFFVGARKKEIGHWEVT
jgi:hypothetical protein